MLSPNLSNTDTSKSSSTQLSIITDEPKKKNIDFLVLKIMKELNSIDEEILDGKDYESNVDTDFYEKFDGLVNVKKLVEYVETQYNN